MVLLAHVYRVTFNTQSVNGLCRLCDTSGRQISTESQITECCWKIRFLKGRYVIIALSMDVKFFTYFFLISSRFALEFMH